MLHRPCLLLATVFLFSPLCRAAEEVALQGFNDAFAISTILTDSNALTLGIANFDLNYLLNSDDPDLGNQESLALRKSLSTLVLPYTWALHNFRDNWSQSVTARVFYIQFTRDNQYLQGVNNFEQEMIFGLYGQYEQQYFFTENWYTEPGLGLHLAYYENEFHYGEGFPEDYKEYLDGLAFNTNALVLMAEPHLNFGYKKSQSWGQWTFSNSNHYVYGRGVGGDVLNAQDINPEGWRFRNGVELKFDVDSLWGISDFIAVDFYRVDVSGDLSGISDKGYYYETGISWVIDTNNKIPFLDNIGVGITINYGSSISGGTLVFYYNE